VILILHSKDVFNAPVVPLRPEVMSLEGIDKLCVTALDPGPLHAPLQHVLHPSSRSPV